MRSVWEDGEQLRLRQVWMSGELAEYKGFPGLSPVAMARQETEHFSEGRRKDSVQYGVSSLEELKPERDPGAVAGPLEH